MAESKKIFLSGRMNKEIDERLIENGEYRDAYNIQVSSTDNSDAGSIQTVLGNKKITDLGFGSNAVCVGSIADNDTDMIYFFIKGNNINGIVQFNTKAATLTYSQSLSSINPPNPRPVLIDARPDATKALKFNGNKITAITILNETLYFTDNSSEPKAVDVSSNSKFILNSTNFSTTTTITSGAFEESDITVIRHKPHNAPKLGFNFDWNNNQISDPTRRTYEDKFVHFGYRWKFKNGQYSAFSPFTNAAFFPSNTNDIDLDEGVNKQMINNLSTDAGSIKLYDIEYGDSSTVGPEVHDIEYIDILYKESNNSNVYVYNTYTKAEIINAYTNGLDVTTPTNQFVLPEDQLFRTYDNVPHRAKSLDTTASRLIFGNYIDGFNVVDYNNNIYQPKFDNFTIQSRSPIANEPTRESLDGTNRMNVNSNSIPDLATIKSGREYQIGIVFEDEYGRQSPVFTDKSGYIKEPFKTANDTVGSTQVQLGRKFFVSMAGSTISPAQGGVSSNLNPNRITRFRYFIKSSSNKFYNIFVNDIKNDLEDNDTTWLVVPSYEVNKVKEGQFLQLKKGLNTNSLLDYAGVADNFKFKVLDISSEKPKNIDASETFDGKFFIKIKKTAQITSNIFENQGIAGKNGEINDSDFKLSFSSISNALFLGQVVAPGGGQDDDFELLSYYFKDGSIYEVVSSISVTTNHPDTFTSSNLGGSAGGAYVNLPASGLNFSDSTGTVTQVRVKYNSNNFPTDFEITYQSQNSNTGVTVGSSPAVFETIPEDEVLDIFYETPYSYPMSQWGITHELDYYNAFVLGNGIESNTINDDFNQDVLDQGVRVSTIIKEEFKERHNPAGLIFSGLINEENFVNKLNEFNVANRITKELNPEYGSIQKLHSRNNDIIAFCEDKVLKILANKDALFNADGSVNLTSTSNVLGQSVPYAGNYGISRNPESFATHGNRLYFTDKQRGSILRLANDGLTVISDRGMLNHFRKKLKDESGFLIGTYDIHSDQYILSFSDNSYSFKENVGGWVSRLAFIPEAGVSLNSNYYTLKNGEIYIHHDDTRLPGSFYYENSDNVSKYNSSVTLIFNDSPSAIKNFKTVSYEGTKGWTIQSNIKTDQEEGKILEFIEKEGKYFAHITGVEESLGYGETGYSSNNSDLQTRVKHFAIQGLGRISSHTEKPVITTTTTLPPTTQTTLPTFTCAFVSLNIPNGIIGDTVTGTVALGAINSISPSVYAEDSAVYTANITVPATGYTNSGSIIQCTTYAVGTAEDVECGFVLSVGTYNNPGVGQTILTGSNFGNDYNTDDNIDLSVPSGASISPSTVTVSQLTSGVTITVTEGVQITASSALIGGGDCSGNFSTNIQAPQSAPVVITGATQGFTNELITLTANTTSAVTSYKWYKSASSGFTPSTSNQILGEGSSSITTTQSAAGTMYYKVKINDTTISNQHSITWTAVYPYTLRGISSPIGPDRNACLTSSSQNVKYGNAPVFENVTRWYNSNSAASTSFSAGTYSTGNNAALSSSATGKYVFINSSGIPGTYLDCSANTATVQRVRVQACNDSTVTRIFNLDIGTNDPLEVNDVFSLTSSTEISGYPTWKITNITSEAFTDEVTFLSKFDNCTASGLTPSAVLSFSNANPFIRTSDPNTFTIVTIQGTGQDLPPGSNVTYRLLAGTDFNNLTELVGYQSGQTFQVTAVDDGNTSTSHVPGVTFPTNTNGSTSTNVYYAIEMRVVDGGVTNTYTAQTSGNFNYVGVAWRNYTQRQLNYVPGSTADAAACSSSTTKTIYSNSISFFTSTHFFSSETGGTPDTGTYSDGTTRIFINGSGPYTPRPSTVDYIDCSTFTITGGGSSTINAAVASPISLLRDSSLNTLTVVPQSFSPSSFSWTREVSNNDGVSFGAAQSVGTAQSYVPNNSSYPETAGTLVKYTCTVQGTPSPFPTQQSAYFKWETPSSKYNVRSCDSSSSSSTVSVEITNADYGDLQGGTVVDVVNLSGGLSGCYKLVSVFTGTATYSATSNATYSGNDACCRCLNCNISISDNINNVSSLEVGESLVLTADASPDSQFDESNGSWVWEVSANPSYGYQTITSQTNAQSNWTSASAGTLYYRTRKIPNQNGSVGSTATREAVTAKTWTLPAQPTERGYTLTEWNTSCGLTSNTITGRYTSINALSANTTVSIGTTCYYITSVGVSFSSSDPEIINTFNSCSTCYASTGGGTTTTTTTTTTTQTQCFPISFTYTGFNPATDQTGAGTLCGNNNTLLRYFNASTLGAATIMYSDASCTSYDSYSRYVSESVLNPSHYYHFTGTKQSGPTALNCSATVYTALISSNEYGSASEACANGNPSIVVYFTSTSGDFLNTGNIYSNPSDPENGMSTLYEDSYSAQQGGGQQFEGDGGFRKASFNGQTFGFRCMGNGNVRDLQNC